jgi:hypothetical protein
MMKYRGSDLAKEHAMTEAATTERRGKEAKTASGATVEVSSQAERTLGRKTARHPEASKAALKKTDTCSGSTGADDD